MSAPKRPGTVVAAFVLLLFLGVSAVPGSAALFWNTVPDEWLDDIPIIDSWLLPALVLFVGFGIGSLVAAYGVWRRPVWGWLAWVERPTKHHWSWLATVLIGLGQVVWIGLEVVLLPEVTWLQAVYGPLGLALFSLAVTPTMRRYLHV